MQRLRVDLFPSTDRDGQTIFVGRQEWPGSVTFKDGAALIVYLEEGQEELHICPLDSPDLDSVFDYYDEQKKRTATRSKHGKLSIRLEPRSKGADGKKFYIGKLRVDAVLDFSKGIVFLVFLADKGQEELQIGTIKQDKIKKKQT